MGPQAWVREDGEVCEPENKTSLCFLLPDAQGLWGKRRPVSYLPLFINYPRAAGGVMDQGAGAGMPGSVLAVSPGPRQGWYVELVTYTGRSRVGLGLGS